MVSPTEEIHARLGYRLAFETIYDEPPTQTVRLIPEFPRGRLDLQEKTNIVWDLPQLLESIRRPGGYDVLNCSCGMSDHAGILELMFIAHPDDDTVVWEIDIHSHRPALDEGLCEAEGFLRLIFRRKDYEADILDMLDAVLSAGTPELPVDGYDPDRDGRTYERLQALAANWDSARLPILRPGSRLEIGCLDDELSRLNGAAYRDYLPRLFTRWEAHAACEHWGRYFARSHGVAYFLAQEGIDIDKTAFGRGDALDRFYLLHEGDRLACDEAGRQFVAVLRRLFAEGNCAPGVIVEYQPCLIPAAVP